MRAPFPWFGGKSWIAESVWARLGVDVEAYAEPFAGTAAVLLARPGWHPDVTWTEQINDADGYIANFWRAVRDDPERVAAFADWPVNENDLHARHAWLVGQKQSMRARLEGDPDWHDPKIAGWWVWGMALWIGGGFCSGTGPWRVVDGQLVHLDGDGRGVRRKLVHLDDDGRGVQRRRVHLDNDGQVVQRRRVHLGDDGQVVRRRVHLDNDGQGVQRKLVHLGDDGQGVADWVAAGDGTQGLQAWIGALSARLARVRVISGDWTRSVTPAARGHHHNRTCGVFLDPPYSAEADRAANLYSCDSGTVAHAVREWCIAETETPNLRIALCGYRDEGHDVLADDLGWTRLDWSARGGYQSAAGANRHREAVWFSPQCVTTDQPTLFALPWEVSS